MDGHCPMVVVANLGNRNSRQSSSHIPTSRFLVAKLLLHYAGHTHNAEQGTSEWYAVQFWSFFFFEKITAPLLVKFRLILDRPNSSTTLNSISNSLTNDICCQAWPNFTTRRQRGPKKMSPLGRLSNIPMAWPDRLRTSRESFCDKSTTTTPPKQFTRSHCMPCSASSL